MALKKRSQARALALQALCQFDALGDAFENELEAFLHDPETFADLGITQPLSPQHLEFARRLVRGAWQARERYDALLKQTAIDWSIARMPPVDRNLLRLGLHEMLNEPETPPEVVINEAVELARIFGGADSPAFVNAVLDANRKRLGLGRKKPSETPGSAN